MSEKGSYQTFFSVRPAPRQAFRERVSSGSESGYDTALLCAAVKRGRRRRETVTEHDRAPRRRRPRAPLPPELEARYARLVERLEDVVIERTDAGTAPRRQLNVGLTPDQYALVEVAAAELGQSVTGFCRAAILQAAKSAVLDGLEPGGAHAGRDVPGWLVSLVNLFDGS